MFNFFSLQSILLLTPSTIAVCSRPDKVWNLCETHNFVLLLFTVRLFSGPWFISASFFQAYTIAFVLELEMSLSFKLNITSFIAFNSVWKLRKKNRLIGIRVEPKTLFRSLLDIFYGNILISCSKTEKENLPPFLKNYQKTFPFCPNLSPFQF